jgi:hypothetical protein
MTCNGCGSEGTCYHVTDRDAVPALELHYCVACVVPHSLGTKWETDAKEFVSSVKAKEKWWSDHAGFRDRVNRHTLFSAAFLAGQKYEREKMQAAK